MYKSLLQFVNKLQDYIVHTMKTENIFIKGFHLFIFLIFAVSVCNIITSVFLCMKNIFGLQIQEYSCAHIPDNSSYKKCYNLNVLPWSAEISGPSPFVFPLGCCVSFSLSSNCSSASCLQHLKEAFPTQNPSLLQNRHRVKL